MELQRKILINQPISEEELKGPGWELADQNEENYNRIICIGKNGWPIERIIRRPFITFLRRLILTKKKMTYEEWLKKGGCKISFLKKYS